jgi:hypothetical protein
MRKILFAVATVSLFVGIGQAKPKPIDWATETAVRPVISRALVSTSDKAEGGNRAGGGLVGCFGGVGIQVTLRGVETEMALEAVLAAIRIDPEEVVEQELYRAMPSCPADRHASTVWTTGGSS